MTSVKKSNVETIISELKKRNEVIPVTNDVVFKAIFNDPDMKGILSYIISEVTKIEYEFILDNITYRNSEIPKNNITNKSNSADMIVDVGNNVISLEMNEQNDIYTRFRNVAHYHSLIVNNIKVSMLPNEIGQVIQINFDNKHVLTSKLISKIMLVDVDSGTVDVDEINFQKYKINLLFTEHLRYNKDELTKFLKILLIMREKNKHELRKLAGSDKELINMVKKIEKISDDPKYVSLYDEEKLDKLARLVEIEDAEKKAEIKKMKETARKMIKKKMAIKDISEITGLTEEEIKKL